jgi:hypothetical protein
VKKRTSNARGASFLPVRRAVPAGIFIDFPNRLGLFGEELVNKGGMVQSDLLHTEKILADRKTFFLDLKENSRGMVVKITEDVGGNRDTIMVPAEILGDFIAALTDIKATADSHG